MTMHLPIAAADAAPPPSPLNRRDGTRGAAGRIGIRGLGQASPRRAAGRSLACHQSAAEPRPPLRRRAQNNLANAVMAAKGAAVAREMIPSGRGVQASGSLADASNGEADFIVMSSQGRDVIGRDAPSAPAGR
jgi:hypothetical protein